MRKESSSNGRQAELLARHARRSWKSRKASQRPGLAEVLQEEEEEGRTGVALNETKSDKDITVRRLQHNIFTHGSERERTDLEDATGSVKVGAGLEPVRVRTEHVEVDVGVQGRAARGDRRQIGRVDVDCLEGEHSQRSPCLDSE